MTREEFLKKRHDELEKIIDAEVIKINFILECTDALDSMLMDVEGKFKKIGIPFHGEYKRRWNMMTNAASQLRCAMKNACRIIYDGDYMAVEDSLNHSDVIQDILRLILDRCGSDETATKMIYHMIHQCPSKLHFYDIEKH